MSKIKVTTICPVCQQTHIIECSNKGYQAYERGALIQQALPELPPEEREMLVSGICPKCWNIVFPE